MKHVALFLSIACLLLFVACGQGEKVEKATVSEPEKATEMVKEGVGENTEMANEEAENTDEMKEGETKKTAEEMAPKKME
jgi:hypothetical protein